MNVTMTLRDGGPGSLSESHVALLLARKNFSISGQAPSRSDSTLDHSMHGAYEHPKPRHTHGQATSRSASETALWSLRVTPVALTEGESCSAFVEDSTELLLAHPLL